MASAFSLFGELSVDTRAFVASMRYADNRMKASERLFIEMEKSKMRMMERSSSHQQRLSEITARVVQKSLSGIGTAMSSLGKAMTVGVSAPLAAIQATAIKSAVGFDTLRTQLKAATGTADSANTKFAELNKLAQANAGVLTSGAVATYAFLKPLGFMDETINETIKAFGKLKAANPEVDLQRMGVNLAQLFDQGFEQQDLKELFGNFPRAGEILQKAFGLSGSDRKTIAEEMKGLMAKGLTREQLFAGFAEGVNTDKFMAGITDPVAVRFEKLKERIMLALEPLGLIIITNLERWAPHIVAFVEKLSAAFTALSPTMQMIATALSGVAIAAGPVLYVLGNILAAIGGLSVSASTIGIIAAVITGIGVALTPIVSIIAFFSRAWVENWELVKQTVSVSVIRITQVVNEFLSVLQGLWATHGEAVMAFLTSWWATLTTTISAAMDIASTALKAALLAIQGDWTGAWNAVLELTSQFFKSLTEWVGNAMKVFVDLIMAAGPMIIQAFTWIWTKVIEVTAMAGKALIDAFVYLPEFLLSLVPKFIAAGLQIGNAIIKGITQGLSNIWNGVSGASAGAGSSMSGGGFFDSLLQNFKNLMSGTGGMSLSASSSLGKPTFLTPVINDAVKTTAALDAVKKKANEVKNAVAPSTAAQADVVRKVYGRAVSVTDTGITMPGSAAFNNAGTPYVNPSTEATNEILSGLTKAVQEGKLAIEIIDPNRSTAIAATEGAVNARYR